MQETIDKAWATTSRPKLQLKWNWHLLENTLSSGYTEDLPVLFFGHAIPAAVADRYECGVGCVGVDGIL